MKAELDPFSVRTPFSSGSRAGWIYSLPELEKRGVGPLTHLPVSIRIVLESVLRNCDGQRVSAGDVECLANWDASDPAGGEIPFVVSRILLQDFTGVPLLVDLAAMRDAVNAVGGDPALIEPLVPVDLVVDHSVQVDRSGTAAAFQQNLGIEFRRNRERYEFLKWGQEAFATFSVIPPAIGIVHQVNLEYLAKVVFETEIGGQTIFYPDTLVGTDSHTTMVNGLGVVGWGVGGIEAEAGMLGQPVYFQTPEVVGVRLLGALREGVTATDLTLRITEMLRGHNVVGKFVEFFGGGASRLTVADRATIANMAPEYGATIGFFPIDENTLDYLRMTGRSADHVALVSAYFHAQDLFGIPEGDEIQYSETLELDLATVEPSVAGPKRPQDRIELPDLADRFETLLGAGANEGGYGVAPVERERRVPVALNNGPHEGGIAVAEEVSEIGHGSVVIAAITSCTNTSNPSVMVAAGLVAKKAVECGLTVADTVKTSLAPGSRVVTEYLNETGLQAYLDKLGFHLVGYGCTTCIGNSGPLAEPVARAVRECELVTASVLSGNRNFEARVHTQVKANFLMSPPLVVAFALAGRVDIDLSRDPLGEDAEGNPVFLADIWPSTDEIQDALSRGLKPEMFRKRYSDIREANPEWNEVPASSEMLYDWKETSTYIQQPPFFESFDMKPGVIAPIEGMRVLAILGDSVTTDHISPAGAIPADEPAGRYLAEHDVAEQDFNSFGSRRGNDRVMTRGTFANIRIRNAMADGREGGWTFLMPDEKLMPIFDACQEYQRRRVPLIVFGGGDYGMGSSRDWAAKGPALLGVKVAVAVSYERIHRNNLIGMGVLPLQFLEGDSAPSLGLAGNEVYSLPGLNDSLEPGEQIEMLIERADGSKQEIKVLVRIDTPIEVDYYRNGGILPYVLRNLLRAAS